MRLIHQDSRTGEIRLYIENLDDLWHLKNIIEPNDLVWADTQRRKEEKSDKLRSERPEKRRMRLGIRVEKVELQEFQDKIRILGIIEDGPQDLGHHHTLMVGPADDVSIVKSEWKKHELDRIEQAIKQSSRPSLHFVSIDDREATVFVMSQFSLKEQGTVNRSGTGKMYESKGDTDSYFEEILGILKVSVGDEPIVILGPGFAKEALLKHMKERCPDLAERVSVVSSGQTGATGVSEIIKKGLGGKALEVSRIAVETRLMEDVLTRISKNEPVAYGPDHVANAVSSGAIELLLITDKQARTPGGENLMSSTEAAGGTVEIISTTHDAGKQLESLGGLAAILRYRID